MNNKSKTKALIVNIFGGPGAGKSTVALEITAELKKAGINAEYVNEYAKELVYAKDFEKLQNQELVTSEQVRRQRLLADAVDVVVSDSPILLGEVYGKNNSAEFNRFIMEEFNSYNNFNIIIKRNGDAKHYQQEGRIENYEQATEKDAQIKTLLKNNNIFFGEYSHTHVQKLLNNIQTNLQRKEKSTLSEIISTEEVLDSRGKADEIYKNIDEEINKIIKTERAEHVLAKASAAQSFISVMEKHNSGNDAAINNLIAEELIYRDAYKNKINEKEKVNKDLLKQRLKKYIEEYIDGITKNLTISNNLNRDALKESMILYAENYLQPFLETLQTENNAEGPKEMFEVSFEQDAIKKYEKASLIRCPRNTPYEGYVFYVPNGAVVDGAEIIDLITETSMPCAKIIFNETFKFTLKKGEQVKELTGKEFFSVFDKSFYNNHKQIGAKFNNTKAYEENTPKELQSKNKFVCMQLSWDESKNKWAKLVKNPKTGGNAQVDNPKTWSSFDEAVESVKKYNFDGIGYVLTGDDNIVGIDIDKTPKGEFSATGQTIIEKFKALSYMERSASGAVHIFGFGQKPSSESRGRDDKTLEIYGGLNEGNRCLMLTGNKMNGLELTDIQEEVNLIHKKEFYRKPVECREVTRAELTLSETEVINLIKNSGSATMFEQLMKGDISNHKNDYNSADLALCSTIAFFTQDRQIIDNIYKQSVLYSAVKLNPLNNKMESRAEKWNSMRRAGTYGNQTIDMALSTLIHSYKPKNSNPKSFEEIEALTVFKETDKAVLIKKPGATASDSKTVVWLPKSQVQLDKDNKKVVAINTEINKGHNFPLKKNCNQITMKR